MHDPVTRLRALGQSVWLDDLSRRTLGDGTLAAMVRSGRVSGVTSNPAILSRAFADDDVYRPALSAALDRLGDPHEALLAVAVEDVRNAADLLHPVWHDTVGRDGWVSIEVDPRLADDTAATVHAALELADRVDRRNALIKIPGTAAGVPAIEDVIAAGVPVNVTLLFSPDRHRAVAEAYVRGVNRLIARGGDARAVASVASFFVSRIDTAVDARLAMLRREDLRGRAAVAAAKLAYATFRAVFRGPSWDRLAAAGAGVQRPLWASTSVKDPAYRDVGYVEDLIGPDTITTVPGDTLAAFLDHGRVAATLEDDLDGARRTFAELAAAGVDLERMALELERDGVERFVAAQDSLLAQLDGRLSPA